MSINNTLNAIHSESQMSGSFFVWPWLQGLSANLQACDPFVTCLSLEPMPLKRCCLMMLGVLGSMETHSPYQWLGLL